MSNLGEQIRKLRLHYGWSQIELAKKLNISNTTLSQYETGVRTPDDGLKIAMADLFNVSMDFLMGRHEKKNGNADYLLGTEERNIYITGNYGTGKSTIITQSFDELLQEKTKKSPSVSDEDIKFALFGGEGEITDEMWEAVREYAQFVKEKYGKK